MERLSETSIGTQTQLHISRKQVGLKLGSLSHKPMVVLKDKMKVGMDWRGKKEVEGETEEAWEEAIPNIKGKLYTLKEIGGLKLGLVSHKPMAVLKGEVEVQMNVEMQKERGADQGQIKLEMEKAREVHQVRIKVKIEEREVHQEKIKVEIEMQRGADQTMTNANANAKVVVT